MIATSRLIDTMHFTFKLLALAAGLIAKNAAVNGELTGLKFTGSFSYSYSFSFESTARRQELPETICVDENAAVASKANGGLCPQDDGRTHAVCSRDGSGVICEPGDIGLCATMIGSIAACEGLHPEEPAKCVESCESIGGSECTLQVSEGGFFDCCFCVPRLGGVPGGPGGY
jgi:hypothetical protein